ncbi:MAG: hypothetical protein IJ180_08425 [Bacteroidales bacterium]|nr:hypothetical protein [Bacteroidales bacterium]
MKKNTSVLFALMLLFASFTFVSCEKNIDEGDDFVSGKWRNYEVISNEELDNYHYRDYVEYAPYNYDFKKRTVTTYTYDSDTTFSYTRGYYTINGDTLTVLDHMERTFVYFLESVKKDTMIYRDSRGEHYKYVRYKGTEYIPPTPEPEEEEEK